MEADLQRYYQLDLRDLWRPRPELTMRRVAAMIRHLPMDAATNIAYGGAGWQLGDYLLADLFRLWAAENEPHPADPRFTEERERKHADVATIRAARARHAARRRRLGITGSVLRTHPDPTP